MEVPYLCESSRHDCNVSCAQIEMEATSHKCFVRVSGMIVMRVVLKQKWKQPPKIFYVDHGEQKGEKIQ